MREVLQGLAEGRYVPGQRLAEPDLMARTGLGRSTVREGLGRLAASGIVVQAPHRGAQIRHLTRRATCDVLRVTDPLLGLAARQAAEAVLGGADAAALVAAAADYDAAADDERPRARARYYRALTVLAGNAELAVAAASREQAYSLMLGDAGQVFNLSGEDDELRRRYGRNKFGQSCLAARRLIENGSKFVTINDGGWDTHKNHFQAMRQKLPILDRGLGTLIADLADRGLLDSTIVWCIGEFGRTPKVATESPWNGGRHHFGSVFSSLVAGGGFRGGHVVGESSLRGEHVKDRPIYPGDLIGTMYQLCGIDPEASLPHPRGDFVRATPGADEGMNTGGRLTEII